MENEIAIDLYAHHMYKYLLPRRMEIPEERQIARKEEDLLIIEVGKAALVTCYEYQEKLQRKFRRDYPKFAKDLCYFMRYSAEIGFALYDEGEDDVFESLLLLTAMILELSAFCHVQGHENLKFYSDICWSEIFKNHFKHKFFENGGWKALNCRSKKNAKIYDTTNCLVGQAPDRMDMGYHWLTRFDRRIENLTINSNIFFDSALTGEEKNILNEIPKEALFDIVKSASVMGQQLSVGESVTIDFRVKQSPLQEFRSQTNVELDKAPINNIPSRNLGAIPKTYKKLQESTDRITEITNKVLLESFRGLILGDKDIAANHLCDVLSNCKNVKLLINDRHFLRQVESSVEDADNKPNYQKILEDALRIISPDSTVGSSHYVENIVLKEETFLNANKNIGLMNTATKIVENNNQTITSENFCSSQDKLELPKLFQTLHEFSGDDESTLKKIIDMLNEMFNFKMDYDFIKKQIEKEFSPSDASQQKSIIDEQIRDIMNAFRSRDILAESKDAEYFSEEHLKPQKLVKEEQIKIAKMMLRQSLGVNIMETSNLFRMSKIFTAEKNRTVYDAIVYCLIGNSKANKAAREIIKFGTSGVVPSQCSNEPQMSEIPKISAVKENLPTPTASKEFEKQSNTNNKNCPAEKQFDMDEVKKTAMKLVIAHHRSKTLLTCLNKKIDRYELSTPSSLTVTNSNNSLTPSLMSSVINEILPVDPVVTDIPEKNPILKLITSSQDQCTNQSPKRLNRIYTDSSDSPTSIDSLPSLNSRTVSPEAEDILNTSQRLESSSNLALLSTEFSSKHEIEMSQWTETKSLYMGARQVLGSSSSGEELFNDVSTGWTSGKDKKQQNRLSPVTVAGTSRKKKKRRRRRK